ncbi:MAG: GAF domain-containing protein [Bacteroidota bacterium]
MTATNNLVQNTESIEDMYDKVGVNQIPYKTQLSFRPLIEELEKRVNSDYPADSGLAKLILEKLPEDHPFRKEELSKDEVKSNCEAFDWLLSSLMPPVMRTNVMVKIGAPFDFDAVYITPPLQNLMETHDTMSLITKESSEFFSTTMLLSACSLILNRFYDQKIDLEPIVKFSVKNKKTGLDQHIKFDINPNFIKVKALKPLKPLSEEDIKRLMSNIYDTDLWLSYIPPENFAFEGFVIGVLKFITAEETSSLLKSSLLQKEAVLHEENIRKLEGLVKAYLNVPDLRLGVTAIDYPPEYAVSHKYRIRFDILADRQERLLESTNRGSIHEKACKYKESVIVEDLEMIKNPTPIERQLMEEGIRSVIIQPLKNKDGRVIGLLEIASPTPFVLHSFKEHKLKEITSMFSLAVERSREEIDNQIEAVIREQFTAVHPSVEWRFIEASYNLLEKRENSAEHASMEPIVFKDVFPLYGQADIVSSSTKRNASIQADLIDNLMRASKLLNLSKAFINFPLADQVLLMVEKGLRDLQREFNSNDESRLVELLHTQVHPIFDYLQVNVPDLTHQIYNYYDELDSELKIIYKKRKEYEDSVTIVNNRIGNLIDQKQKEAQLILPHYFEKYKTDGVEYDMYIGDAMLRHGGYTEMHLRNLRLWQLITMYEVTQLVDMIQPELPTALTTAQLIFAYNTPLSIQFRMDEKKFDVDGAYNVRYEILKKRIDKAVIQGTSERLTVAGKIAIVYLQEKDKQEYLEYFEYMKARGFITDEVEDLTLGKLQGVQGLKALRVTVKPLD